MLGLVLPALAIGPAATALLWSHHPMMAIASAPISASAAVLGLAVWMAARKKPSVQQLHRSTKACAHFGAEWHGSAHA